LNSYIVRIYRQEQNETDNLVGIVEFPEDGEKKSFKNIEDLARILTLGDKQRAGGVRSKYSGRKRE